MFGECMEVMNNYDAKGDWVDSLLKSSDAVAAILQFDILFDRRE